MWFRSFSVECKEGSRVFSTPAQAISEVDEFRLEQAGKRNDCSGHSCALFSDQARNDLIVRDLEQALSAGRSPLVLTGRTEHLDYLAERLRGICSHTFILKGGMGAKQRKKLADSLAAVSPSEPRVTLATGSYLGEGFDDRRLDTLLLVTPISWKGTLQQYVGRLHRLHKNKSEVQVYDYADLSVPMLARMYRKRLAECAALGYAITESHAPSC